MLQIMIYIPSVNSKMNPQEIGEDVVMQEMTENWAVAWSNKHLADNFHFSNEFVTNLVATLSTMWSSTGSSQETIALNTNKFIKECEELRKTHVSDANTFMALMMAFIIYKRSVRHGGGRKDESRAGLISVCTFFVATNPELVKVLLKSYFTEGYWKDAFLLLQTPDLNVEIFNITVEIVVEQLRSDADISQQLVTEFDVEKRSDLIKKISNCGKWCPQPKGEKKKPHAKAKAKANVDTNTSYATRMKFVLLLASALFPEVVADTWYYKNVGGKLDKSIIVAVNEKTPMYYRWRTLFSLYSRFMGSIRKNIPYVEKNMRKGHFSDINPSMLTSVNKLRLDATLTGAMPRYLNSSHHTRSATSKAQKQMPKARLAELRKKYGTDRLDGDEDRQNCADTYKKYLQRVVDLQKEKARKMEELQTNIASSTTSVEDKQKMIDELLTLQQAVTINFGAGTPVDVWAAYDTSSTCDNVAYEACIRELGLGKLAGLTNLRCLCVADTSGSMSTLIEGHQSIQRIDVCVAMTAFLSMFAPKEWRHKFIQFAGTAHVRSLQNVLGREPSFREFCLFISEHKIHDMTTNFESVLNTLNVIFKDVSKDDLPKYIIFWSDMQFNQAVSVGYNSLTAGQQLKKLFVEKLGFLEEDCPTMIFWNLADHSNRPALASDDGVVMLSGFNPKMLLDLDAVIASAVSSEEMKVHLNQEMENALRETTVNTWSSLVKILSTNEATVPLLKAIYEQLPHELLVIE
jgi:hypothetical protein